MTSWIWIVIIGVILIPLFFLVVSIACFRIAARNGQSKGERTAAIIAGLFFLAVMAKAIHEFFFEPY